MAAVTVDDIITVGAIVNFHVITEVAAVIDGIIIRHIRAVIAISGETSAAVS